MRAKPKAPENLWEDLFKELELSVIKGRSHPGVTLDEYKERMGFPSAMSALRDLRRRSEKGELNATEGKLDGKDVVFLVKPPLGVPSRVSK